MKAKVEVSNRHVHLNQELKNKLFGEDFKLPVKRELSQIGEFASKVTVDIKVGNKIIEKVRVVGPLRKYSQVEISKTDANYLGINPPIRNSGELDDALDIVIVGPKKEELVKKCVILSNRHLHINPSDAKDQKLKNNQKVKAIINGKKMTNIYVKVGKNYTRALHIDVDDARAFNVDKEDEACILKNNIIKEAFVLLIEILIIAILLDFIVVKFFDMTPVFSYKKTAGDNTVYYSLGYKLHDCNKKRHISSYNDKYICPEEKPSFEIEDRTGEFCAEMLLYIYEDEEYKYYLPCLRSIYLIFKDKTELTLIEAIERKIVNIAELEEKGLKIFKEKK